MAAALGAVYTLGWRVADTMPLVMRALEHTMATERVSSQVLYHLSLRGAAAG
jgi:hypothetical protein